MTMMLTMTKGTGYDENDTDDEHDKR